MSGRPQVALLPDGRRLHPHHGPIDLIIEVFGPEIGRHARSAIGVSGLPMGFAMEIEGEVLLRS